MAPDDELTPELVLVAPELAAEARAALPDRPWEEFAPPRLARRVVPIGPIAPQARSPGLLERAAAILPIVLLVLFVAVLVVGSLPGMSQRPTLGPPEPASTTQPIVTTTP